MASDRFQRRIDRLLDQVEEAADQRNWERVRQLAEDVLTADPGNLDAVKYLATVERGLSDYPATTKPAILRTPRAAGLPGPGHAAGPRGCLRPHQNPPMASHGPPRSHSTSPSSSRLLDQVEEAADQRNWERVRQLAEDVLTADPGNLDAVKYLATVERGLSDSAPATQPAGFPTPPGSEAQLFWKARACCRSALFSWGWRVTVRPLPSPAATHWPLPGQAVPGRGRQKARSTWKPRTRCWTASRLPSPSSQLCPCSLHSAPPVPRLLLTGIAGQVYRGHQLGIGSTTTAALWEAFAAAFAPMAHLRVVRRRDPVPAYAILQGRTILLPFHILQEELPQEFRCFSNSLALRTICGKSTLGLTGQFQYQVSDNGTHIRVGKPESRRVV